MPPAGNKREADSAFAEGLTKARQTRDELAAVLAIYAEHEPLYNNATSRTGAPRIQARSLEQLLRETDRLRLDMLRAESDRYPAQYRTYIEAYLRSLNGIRR